MKYPSLQQVRELPCDLRMGVPVEWEDRNGHVNVQYYLRLYELGGWKILENEGFDEDWFRQRQRSFFDLENHLRYLAEIHVGERVSAYHRLLGVSIKRFHGAYLIVNDSRERLAAVIEYVTAMVDMSVRRSADFPPELSAALQTLLARHDKLNWQVPVSGVMKP